MSSLMRVAMSLAVVFAATASSAADISESSLRAADAEQMRIIVEGDAKAQSVFMHDNYIINGPSNRVMRKPVLVDMLAHGNPRQSGGEPVEDFRNRGQLRLF